MEKIHQRVPHALQFTASEVIYVLIAVNMAFLTSLINEIGVISIIASFLFAYVVIVTFLMRFRGTAKDATDGTDFSFVQKEVVEGFIILVHRFVFAIQSRIRAIETGDDLRAVAQLLVAFYLAGLVGTILSPLTIMWIVANFIAFSSLVATNEKVRNTFDNAYDKTAKLTESVTGIITDRIPKYSNLKLD